MKKLKSLTEVKYHAQESEPVRELDGSEPKPNTKDHIIPSCCFLPTQI